MADPTNAENAAQPGAAPENGAGDNRSPEELRTALAQAEATAAENWNRYLRAVAELENFRKRAARDVEQARQAGVERLAAELIPVIDGLELGIDQVSRSGPGDGTALLEGAQATLRLLRAAFEKFGIETLDPAGQPFDPQLHEAMSLAPAAGATPGSVLVVMQKGYRLKERLLRPARVVVAGEAPAEGEEPRA
jgi:molecular chaperone GrpE